MNRQFLNKGFTIVELLVVVVIIAILATITIVAYNGIQQHARTVAILGAVDAWQKNIQLDAVTYAPPTTGVFEMYWQCLGRSAADFPAQNGFLAGECLVQSDGVDTLSVRWDGYYHNGVLVYSALPTNWWSSSFKRTDGLLPVVQVPQNGITLRTRGIVVSASRDVGGERTISAIYGTQDSKCGRGDLAGSDETQAGDIKGGYCNVMILRGQ